MRKLLLWVFVCSLLASALLPGQRRLRDRWRKKAETPVQSGSRIGGIEYKVLTEKGGRVAWYQGQAHELIAFDRITNQRTKGTDLFLMQPDGSGERCVTCSSGLRKGFIGQPSWHPDGERLLIQVENENSEHRFYNHMSFGIDNDLYLIRKDGSRPVKLFSPDRFGAVLHPHFRKDGKLVIWSERVPMGDGKASLRRITPDGENHWDGWRVHLADFDPVRESLSNHRWLQPNGNGFYETHGFSPEGRIVYSFTAKGRPYVDDVYEMDLNGRGARNRLNSPSTWDEHGAYSPNGRWMAFMSSRLDPSLAYPQAKPQQLRSELYLIDSSGAIRQVTNMNEKLNDRIVVSDYDWDRSGRRIVFQVARLDGSKVEPQLWVATLPESYD